MVSLLICVIITAIIFDYINGFHDAANAIATVVSTGVLPIRTAVMIAGILNFVGAITGTAVAKTIASGFADPAIVTQSVVLAALLGACIWNLITWWYGIPSSSSHALIGALAGAVVAKAGVHAFHWKALYEKVLIPLVASPLIGFTVAFILMISLLWIVGIARQRPCTRLHDASSSPRPARWPSRTARTTRRSRWASSPSRCSPSSHAGHGAGVPDWVLPHHGDHVPTWVILACASAIAVGTMAGGKRIIKTMGSKIIRITPIQGFAAETAGAITILGASQFGVPVSTTHVINACIMGVGASKRVSAVRWGVAGNILTAWVLTLPLSAAFAYAAMKALSLFVTE